MAFAIVAHFLLGTYRGRRMDQSPELLPSPARLHSALLNAAALGPDAQVVDGLLAPSDQSRAALAWLEDHPPDGLAQPEHDASPPSGATSFRNKGIFRREADAQWLETRPGGDADGGVAYGGPLAWTWESPPPPSVAASLEALCREVPYLGTTESPVILRVGEVEPTHVRDANATPFSGAGVDVAVPRQGRTATLERLHLETALRVPSTAQDRPSSDEREVHSRLDLATVATARYVPMATGASSESAALPWDRAVVYPLGRMPVATDRVQWAVAIHRALVAVIGDGAPPLVTGRYLADAPQPANRLAIQFVARHPKLSVGASAGAGALVLLVPSDASDDDLGVLDQALRTLRNVRVGNWSMRLPSDPQVVDAAAFWRAPDPGYQRVWTTVPVAIPESPPVRGHVWSLADAALLSLGLAFRERLGGRARGRLGILGLLEAVRRQGAAVLSARYVHRSPAERFIHRVRPEMVVRPYQATMSLGGLAGDGAIMAIGQSRHLGGGLLWPLDLLGTTGER